jgi:hypothetical protein
LLAGAVINEFLMNLPERVIIFGARPAHQNLLLDICEMRARFVYFAALRDPLMQISVWVDLDLICEITSSAVGLVATVRAINLHQAHQFKIFTHPHSKR